MARHRPGRTPLASTQEISAFLAEVERRAFKQAMFAVRDEHAALDIVQDAMLKLTEKYAQKPTAELPMLFHRILQNTIHDHFRRQKVRSTWTTVLSALGKGDEKDEDFDPLETLPAKSDSNATADPAAQLQSADCRRNRGGAYKAPRASTGSVFAALLEELDVAETAVAMGCSEGSSTTPLLAAVQALPMLKAKAFRMMTDESIRQENKTLP
jgi:RNA polymerase sigma-70 factor (ECF subfamily)